MSRDGLIRNPGSRRFPRWVLNQLGKCDFIQFIHIYPKKDDLGGHNQLLQQKLWNTKIIHRSNGGRNSRREKAVKDSWLVI
jgi:hypothetical protein